MVPAPGHLPDRLQVRMSTNGASTDVGTTATSVGDFTTLCSISTRPTARGLPACPDPFTVTLSGIPGGSTLGRLAFRYFVENGGPSGDNSDYIGIDATSYTGGCRDTNTNGYTNRNSNSDANSHSASHTNGHTNGNTASHAYANAYGDPERNPVPSADSRAKRDASRHATASTLRRLAPIFPGTREFSASGLRLRRLD